MGKPAGTNPFSHRELRIIADNCWQPEPNTYEPVQKKFGSTETTVMVSETQFGWYIKPTVPHYKYQFEDFFGFGHGNLGFHKGRTMFVPK